MTTMTPAELLARLPELRALEEAATKGPWHTQPQRVDGADEEAVIGHSNAIWAGPEYRAYPVVTFATARPAKDGDPWVPMIHISAENAALIVAARTALPALLTLIETQSADIARLREALEPFAELAEWYDDAEDDGFLVWSDYPHGFRNRRLAELRHFRRAKTALTESSKS